MHNLRMFACTFTLAVLAVAVFGQSVAPSVASASSMVKRALVMEPAVAPPVQGHPKQALTLDTPAEGEYPRGSVQAIPELQRPLELPPVIPEDSPKLQQRPHPASIAPTPSV